MFSERLKKLRKHHNYTQDFVAEKMDISRVAYTKYEGGKTMPSPENIEKLADLFKVSVDYLFGRTDDPTPYREVDSDLDSSPDEELKQLLSDPQMRVAFLDYASWSDEDKRELVNFIKFKKSQRDGKEGK
jgi:transcriptional regulator with XRE-family HTH domain